MIRAGIFSTIKAIVPLTVKSKAIVPFKIPFKAIQHFLIGPEFSYEKFHLLANLEDLDYFKKSMSRIYPYVIRKADRHLLFAMYGYKVHGVNVL